MRWDPESIKNNLLMLAGLLVIASILTVVAKARNGEVRQALSVGAIIMIAALVIALSSRLQEIGEWLYHLIFA